MEKLLLCTGNQGKVLELKALLPKGIEPLSLADVGLPADLPETGATLEACGTVLLQSEAVELYVAALCYAVR